MSRNSAGTYSLPAGNPVVSGTTISSTTQNTTLSDVASEITNSLDRNGRGAMLAPLVLPNGSSTAPAVAFSTEVNTGLYRAGSGDVRVVIGGGDAVKVTSSGVTVDNALTVGGAVAGAGGTLAVTGNVTTTGATTVGGTLTAVGTLTASGPLNGLNATLLPSAGTALIATGGSGNGLGVWGTGNGTGPGLRATGGTGAALEVQGGNAVFTGPNPASSAGFSSTITPKNICKAWGYVSAISGVVTILDGFNLSSATIGSDIGQLIIHLSASMASANYAVMGTSSLSNYTIYDVVASKSSSSFVLSAKQASSDWAWNSGSATVSFFVFGAQ